MRFPGIFNAKTLNFFSTSMSVIAALIVLYFAIALSITVAVSRMCVSRNGSVAASVAAREVAQIRVRAEQRRSRSALYQRTLTDGIWIGLHGDSASDGELICFGLLTPSQKELFWKKRTDQHEKAQLEAEKNFMIPEKDEDEDEASDD